MSKKLQQTREAKLGYDSVLLQYLIERAGDWFTKEQLQEILHCSEREVRNILSDIGLYYPLISTSRKKGYHMPKRIENMTGAEMLEEYILINKSLSEDASRIKELNRKRKAKIAFKVELEKRLNVEG